MSAPTQPPPRQFSNLDWLRSSIDHATRQKSVPTDCLETIIVALTAIHAHLSDQAWPPPTPTDEKNWPTFSMLLHGCKGCGEECHPVRVAGYWICPDCRSMDLVCIELDTELLTEAINRLRPPTTDAEMTRLQALSGEGVGR